MQMLTVFTEINNQKDCYDGAAWYLAEQKYQIPDQPIRYNPVKIKAAAQKELIKRLVPMAKPIAANNVSPQLHLIYHNQKNKPALYSVDLLTLANNLKPADLDFTFSNKHKSAICDLLNTKLETLSWEFDEYGLYDNLKDKSKPDQLKHIRLILWLTD